MNQKFKQTERRFYWTIVASVALVILFVWASLQIFNLTTIGGASSAGEIEQITAASPSVAQYIESEKENQAHFISLASLVKSEEQDRLTTVLVVVTLSALALTAGIAYALVKKLMKPIVEAQQSQERFLQDAAHELRNPLAALSLSLQEAERTNQQSKLIDTFRRQTNRLVRINEDLLFLERAKKSEIADIDVSSLLHDIIEDMQPHILRKNIKLGLNIDDGIIKRMTTEDFLRLAKNLIENAIKYSRKNGQIDISLNRNKQVVLTVADKGIGIPAADLASVGERFFRASNTGKYNGTGLGLAIVQKILNSYGGQLQIDSQKSQGTTVVATF